MKFLVLILLIFPKLLLGQEVFIDSSNKEYLYLGSTQNNEQLSRAIISTKSFGRMLVNGFYE